MLTCGKLFRNIYRNGAVTLRNDAFLIALCLQFKVNSHCKQLKQAPATTKQVKLGLCAEVSTVEIIPLCI